MSEIQRAFVDKVAAPVVIEQARTVEKLPLGDLSKDELKVKGFEVYFQRIRLGITTSQLEGRFKAV
jgi:hypothetical protein